MGRGRRVSSDLSLNIEYAGAPLQPTTCYFWTVNVWNQKGEQSSSTSWFETGLMSKTNPYEGWSDAKWIGGGDEDMVLYSPLSSGVQAERCTPVG